MKRSTSFRLLAAVLLASSFAASARAQPSPPSLTLHFINVGQGDSTLITCPNGATILIDAGSLPLSTATQTRVRNYVINQITPLGGDIDYLILSHPDTDHYNLLRAALAGVPIGRAYYVGTRGNYTDPSIFTWISGLANSIHLADTDFDPEVTPNAAIDCGAAQVWILAAGEQTPDDDNNAKSIVVMVRFGDFEAVITGDATLATERAILARYRPAWLDIDVLRVGHHGSLTTSTSLSWANTLTPRTAIFSAGSTNSYGHPRTEVVARLTPHTDAAPAHRFRDARSRGGRRYAWTDYPAYRESAYATAANGTIVIRTPGTGYSVTSER